MAYLKPARLTCPNCGLSGEVTKVIGVGPHTTRGQGPAYIRFQRSGPFLKKLNGPRQILTCPDCGAEVAKST